MIRRDNFYGKSVRSSPNLYDNSAAKITTGIWHSTTKQRERTVRVSSCLRLPNPPTKRREPFKTPYVLPLSQPSLHSAAAPSRRQNNCSRLMWYTTTIPFVLKKGIKKSPENHFSYLQVVPSSSISMLDGSPRSLRISSSVLPCTDP